MRSPLPLAAFAAAIAVATSAHASIWSANYDPSALPSSQGWGYYSLNSGLTEADVFSTSGGVLTSNTIGNGYQGQGGNFAYASAAPGSFTTGQDWVVEARVRVLEGELWSFHYGFCIGASFDGISASVGIMPGTWQDSSLNGAARDNTQWTTWRIETDRQAGVFSLYADGVLLAVRGLGPASPVPGGPSDYAFLGDGTGGANARAEISSYSFTQVPAPGAVALLGLGLASRRRRSR